MSRYSGCWVAFKALTDTVETSSSVDIDPFTRADAASRARTTSRCRVDGLNLRWPDPPLVQEKRLLHHKLYAALAYCRAQPASTASCIDPPERRAWASSPAARATSTCARRSTTSASTRPPPRRSACACTRSAWCGRSTPRACASFADGLDEILVIEEKRQFLEYQLKEELYNWKDEVRPRVIGKFDEKGEWSLPHADWLLPAAGELTPAMIARAIAGRIARFHTSDRIKARLAFIEAKEAALAKPRLSIQRVPHYCSGCPHNTSTKVPQGSRAIAGIGCHYMATWLSPEHTQTFCQMGGEGVPWIGQAPFTDTPHVFANLGDGTYMPLGHPGHPRRGGGEGEHHLQDPLQRRGGDDRRPAARRHAVGADHRPPAARRGRGHGGGGQRRHAARLRPGRPAARRGRPPPRRARRGAARAAHGAGGHRASSTTRPAPPRSAAAASAASSPTRPGAW